MQHCCEVNLGIAIGDGNRNIWEEEGYADMGEDGTSKSSTIRSSSSSSSLLSTIDTCKSDETENCRWTSAILTQVKLEDVVGVLHGCVKLGLRMVCRVLDEG